MKHTSLLLKSMMMVALSLLLFQSVLDTARSESSSDSPATTQPSSSESIPLQPSVEAQKALLYISEREHIPIESLLIINDFERGYPFTGRSFRAVTILDIRTEDGQEFKVLVDLADGHIEEDVNVVEATEKAAYEAKFGKIHPTLFSRLGDPHAIYNASSR